MGNKDDGFTYQEWADAPYDTFRMTDEQVEEIKALFKPVQEKLLEYGGTGSFQFVRELDHHGLSQMHGVTIWQGLGRATLELLLMGVLTQEGMQGVVDDIDYLVEAANLRVKTHKPSIQ